MPQHTYFFTQKRHNTRTQKNQPTVCKKCGTALLGLLVVTYKHSRGKTQIYHKTCWEALHIQ